MGGRLIEKWSVRSSASVLVPVQEGREGREDDIFVGIKRMRKCGRVMFF
jgi:hypothetical protein